MAFINERISESDMLQYQIEEIDEKLFAGHTLNKQWTIDRERGMYLRMIKRGREEASNRSTWLFCRNSEYIILELETLSTSGKRGGHRELRQKLRSIKLPKMLHSCRNAVLADLRDALVAHKGSGIHSTASSFAYELVAD